MVGDLRRGLCEEGFTVSQLSGCFQRIPHGGLKAKRLINALFMLLLLPLFLIFKKRYDLVVVRSTPPLLHLPTATLCSWLNIPCVFWLMDYHPEMEKRLWGKRGLLAYVLQCLDRWDRWALSRFQSVVVLDDAMDALVQSRAPGLRTIVHPTWGQFTKVDSPAVHQSMEKSRVGVTLAYVGNFGRGHVWGLMVRVVESLASKVPVLILAVGIPAGVEGYFLELSELENVTVEIRPRLPFEEVVTVLQQEQVDYGCVAMRSELQGCLSPSKFASYLEAQVPVLYIGPEGTNTCKICADFDGGVWLPESPDELQFETAISMIASKEFHQKAQSGVLRAQKYFRSFNGESLAQAMTASLDRSM